MDLSVLDQTYGHRTTLYHNEQQIGNLKSHGKLHVLGLTYCHKFGPLKIGQMSTSLGAHNSIINVSSVWCVSCVVASEQFWLLSLLLRRHRFLS